MYPYIQRIIPKKTGFFKEQNAGFSAQIHRLSLKKHGFKKKACYVKNVRPAQPIKKFQT